MLIDFSCLLAVGAGKLLRRPGPRLWGGLSRSKPDTNNAAIDEAAMSPWDTESRTLKALIVRTLYCGWPRVVLGNRGWGREGVWMEPISIAIGFLALRLPANLVIGTMGTLKPTTFLKPP